jgi:hypothetical protein
MTNLEAFARQVLDILETHENWSSDTTDDIAQAAYDWNLADCDAEEGIFKATPDNTQ